MKQGQFIIKELITFYRHYPTYVYNIDYNDWLLTKLITTYISYDNILLCQTAINLSSMTNEHSISL